jgi:non-ribosomal peptide synthetase component F
VARIEAQAARTPDAKAVVAGGTRLSYDALNGRANQVAWWLRAAGVGREDRVAVFGERNVGWLTFVLGILKAGAAFVPLDPLQPDARLASIVSSSRIRVMACGPVRSRALCLRPPRRQYRRSCAAPPAAPASGRRGCRRGSSDHESALPRYRAAPGLRVLHPPDRRVSQA